MYKTSVNTLVNGNIEELALRKQQKSQKMILPASHWLCVNVLLNTGDTHWLQTDMSRRRLTSHAERPPM